MPTANVTFRMDEALKTQAEYLFEDMGMKNTKTTGLQETKRISANVTLYPSGC